MCGTVGTSAFKDVSFKLKQREEFHGDLRIALWQILVMLECERCLFEVLRLLGFFFSLCEIVQFRYREENVKNADSLRCCAFFLAGRWQTFLLT